MHRLKVGIIVFKGLKSCGLNPYGGPAPTSTTTMSE